MSNEKIIRKLVINELCPKGALPFEEFTCNDLCTRNDVMFVDKHDIISIEIKSDADNLKRLAAQITEYKQYSTKVIVVIDQKHLKAYTRDMMTSSIFNGIGLYVFDGTNLMLHTKPLNTEYKLLFNLMWSSELSLFFKGLKNYSKPKELRGIKESPDKKAKRIIPGNSQGMKRMISDIFTLSEIHLICKELFYLRIYNTHMNRKNRYTPYSNEFIDKIVLSKQECVTEYLKGKYEEK